jgi:hypothetical protein
MEILTIAIILSFVLFFSNSETSESGSFVCSDSKSCSAISVSSEDVVDVVDEDIGELKELYVFCGVIE